MTNPSMPPPWRRWDAPWKSPVGTKPARDAGEPGLAALAVLHLAVYLGLSALAGVLAPFAQDSVGTAAALYAVLALFAVAAGGYAGWRARQEQQRLWDWAADLLLAGGALIAGVSAGLTAVAGGTNSGRADSGDVATALSVAAVTTAVVAGSAYVLVRRTWLQVTTVAGLAVALVSLLERGDGVPRPVVGAFLLLLAGFVLAGALARVIRPVGVAYVVGGVVALAAAQVLLAGESGSGAELGAGYAVSVVVVVAVGWAVVRTRSASMLPVALLGGVVLLPQVLSPLLGAGYATGLSVLGVAVAVAWLTADVVRRAVRPVHTGGVFLVCTVLVLFSAPGLAAGGNDLVGLLAAAGVAGFFAAAATVRRRPATVLSGLLLLVMGPVVLAAPLGGSGAARSLVGLALVPLLVLLAVQLDRRAPRPAASPYAQEQALAGAGETFTLVAAFPVVFDAAVGLLGGAGLPLQLVDRAGGRIVAGEAAAPVFVIAVWAADAVRTHVRVVGAPADVTRLRSDLEARTTTGPVPRY